MSDFKQVWVVLKRLGFSAMRNKANRLLGVCILVCSAVAATLSFFAQSVQLALDNDIANYLGAPLVIRSNQAFGDEQDYLRKFPGIERVANTVSLTTGAISAAQYQSVSLKAVSSAYPIQGELNIRIDGEESRVTARQLQSGSVWLDQRALYELQVGVGERVQIGEAQLLVAGELTHEPDRLTQLQHALPRAMMSRETLAKTGVERANNRGEYRLLLAGDAAALTEVEANIASQTLEAEHASGVAQIDILKPGKGRHPFSRISQRAEKLLSVVLVLILLMCGGAAASLADHTVRHYALPATVLRCMGVARRAVAWALCLQLMALALLMSLVACVLAWLVQPWLHDLMAPHMILAMPPFRLRDLAAPMAIGLVTVIAFVVPKLQQLGSISVISALRGQLQYAKRFYAVPVLAAALVATLLWVSSDNLQLSMMLIGVVVVLLVLSISVGWLLSKTCGQAHRLFRGPMKIAVRSIGRSPARHITPLTSVALVMMAILMTVTLRGSFLDMFQVQTLETDGNYIFTGLPAEQQVAFQTSAEQVGAQVKQMHPTVSAKLVAINGVAFEKALNKESDTREEARSRVRLSWANTMPSNNRLLGGIWPVEGSGDVSVEAEVMTDLGLKMGDRLRFAIGDQFLEARISSRREYKGGGSRMMFWFMFAEDALAPFDQHRMGGLQIDGAASEVLAPLVAEFSQVRFTDLERQISGIRNIMIVLTRLMNAVLVLLLSGALVVIMASSFVSSKNRTRQMQLFRALGLKRRYGYIMNMLEHSIVGLVACTVGIIGAQLIAGTLFHSLFAIGYQLDWSQALGTTVIITGIFLVFGAAFAFRQQQNTVTLSALD